MDKLPFLTKVAKETKCTKKETFNQNLFESIHLQGYSTYSKIQNDIYIYRYIFHFKLKP